MITCGTRVLANCRSPRGESIASGAGEWADNQLDGWYPMGYGHGSWATASRGAGHGMGIEECDECRADARIQEVG